MAYQMISNCPVCSKVLKVTKLSCTHCHTTIENEFELSKFATLSQEQLFFVEIFLKSRGNIKEVEKELGVSYPTVRGKLNDIITALGFVEKKSGPDDTKVIDMLENGEITLDEALKTIKKN